MADPSVICGDALIEFCQFLMHIAHQIPDHLTKAIDDPVHDLSETTPQASGCCQTDSNQSSLIGLHL